MQTRNWDFIVLHPAQKNKVLWIAKLLLESSLIIIYSNWEIIGKIGFFLYRESIFLYRWKAFQGKNRPGRSLTYSFTNYSFVHSDAATQQKCYDIQHEQLQYINTLSEEKFKQQERTQEKTHKKIETYI